MLAAYGTVSALADALRRAAEAHGKHDKEIGHADPDWPDWYDAAHGGRVGRACQRGLPVLNRVIPDAEIEGFTDGSETDLGTDIGKLGQNL